MLFLWTILLGVTSICAIIMYGAQTWRDSFFQPFPGFFLIAILMYYVGIWGAPFEIHGRTHYILLLGLSSFLAGIFLNLKIHKVDPQSAEEITASLHATFPLKYVTILALTGLLAVIYIWSKTGIPLFAADVDAARALYSSNGYIAQIGTLLDISAVASYAYLLTFKGKHKTKLYYLALVIILVFIIVAILGGSRTRLLKLVLPAMIIRHYFYSKLGPIKLLIWGVVGAAFVGALGFYRAYSRWGTDVYEGLQMSASSTTLLDLIIHYASFELYIPIYGLQIVSEQIPRWSDYTLGLLHLGPLLMPLQIDLPTPGEHFKQVIGGTWSGFGLAATIFAPIYADFGILGVAIISIIYGLAIGHLYNKTRTNSSSAPYSIICYGIAYVFFLTGLRSNLVSFEFLWFLAAATSIGYFRKRIDRPPIA